jgi:hypothetical protein
VEDGDLEGLRQHLASRKWRSLERLEDAVLELYAVHGLDEETIVSSVRAAIDAERSRPEPEVGR